MQTISIFIKQLCLFQDCNKERDLGCGVCPLCNALFLISDCGSFSMHILFPFCEDNGNQKGLKKESGTYSKAGPVVLLFLLFGAPLCDGDRSITTRADSSSFPARFCPSTLPSFPLAVNREGSLVLRRDQQIHHISTCLPSSAWF